ncbi:hypothetical protein KUCAC02_015837 [Chaenocephalus aceratus]|uniref:Uncharacterized protein n=1 Tax=Chaenocephalus aceratus TaxID=36190 RepID=A0ACB9Y0I0_CHAAC|nr:hypothetical protein KUCAC02_015837 [Chaenocephalus aceratus]
MFPASARPQCVLISIQVLGSSLLCLKAGGSSRPAHPASSRYQRPAQGSALPRGPPTNTASSSSSSSYSFSSSCTEAGPSAEETPLTLSCYCRCRSPVCTPLQPASRKIDPRSSPVGLTQLHHGGIRRPTDEERSRKPSVSAGNQQREIFYHRH